jgi:hypothetical protein
MKCNVGKTDRTVRVILGLAILAAGLFYESWWGLAGLVPLASAAAGWCPLYGLFGWSTRTRAETRREAEAA